MFWDVMLMELGNASGTIPNTKLNFQYSSI